MAQTRKESKTATEYEKALLEEQGYACVPSTNHLRWYEKRLGGTEFAQDVERIAINSVTGIVFRGGKIVELIIFAPAQPEGIVE